MKVTVQKGVNCIAIYLFIYLVIHSFAAHLTTSTTKNSVLAGKIIKKIPAGSNVRGLNWGSVIASVLKERER